MSKEGDKISLCPESGKELSYIEEYGEWDVDSAVRPDGRAGVYCATCRKFPLQASARVYSIEMAVV